MSKLLFKWHLNCSFESILVEMVLLYNYSWLKGILKTHFHSIKIKCFCIPGSLLHIYTCKILWQPSWKSYQIFSWMTSHIDLHCFKWKSDPSKQSNIRCYIIIRIWLIYAFCKSRGTLKWVCPSVRPAISTQ